MQKQGAHTDLGAIMIHENVIASIASIASGEIEGVKRIGSSLKGKIIELIGRKNSCGGIKVEFDKTGEVSLEIPLFIKYEYNIPDVANKVQENVRISLEKMTNLSVRDININVQGIERG